MIENQNFGQALEALKNKKKVSRVGWNGKEMFLELVTALEYQIENHNLPLNNLEPTGNIQNLLPFIMMKTATNEYVPWLASQTDVLAEDWCILIKLIPLHQYTFNASAHYECFFTTEVNCTLKKIQIARFMKKAPYLSLGLFCI